MRECAPPLAPSANFFRAQALFYAPYGHDAPIAFVETLGFCLFGRSSRHYRPAAGAGDAGDALLFVSVFSDAAELEDYAAADDGLTLPDVADVAALARAKARRAPRWPGGACARYALPFAILAALSLAVYAAVLVGPLSFIADGLRDAAVAAARRGAAAATAAAAAAKPQGAAPFAAPLGMTILYNPPGAGGEEEL